MEVHHHTHAGPDMHRGSSKKRWTHYFWEFLMLFLAVFAGFLAENQREHYVEHQREKQYIRSMIEDLQTDTLNLDEVITGLLRKSARLDSVIRGYDEGIVKYDSVWAKSFLRSYRLGYPDYFSTDRTLQQLKNAGGLRLIRNEVAAKGIISYDALTKDFTAEEQNISEAQRTYMNAIMNIWSIRKMYQDAGVSSWTNNRSMMVRNNYWLTEDPIAKEHLFNALVEFNEAILRQVRFYEQLKKEAKGLTGMLKKEYRMK